MYFERLKSLRDLSQRFLNEFNEYILKISFFIFKIIKEAISDMTFFDLLVNQYPMPKVIKLSLFLILVIFSYIRYRLPNFDTFQHATI